MPKASLVWKNNSLHLEKCSIIFKDIYISLLISNFVII